MIETEEGERQEVAMSPRVTTTPQDNQESQFEVGVGRSITVELLAAWNAQLRQEACALCPVSGCGLMFHSAPQIQSHYVTCSGKPDGCVVRCEQCQARVPSSLLAHHNRVMHHHHHHHPDPEGGTAGGTLTHRNRGHPTTPSARVSGCEGVREQQHLICPPTGEATDTTSLSSPR
ncbi:hypothetical protein GWK47_021338 [Chionoecetes opilio]|uniref:C2H2-type domain-containing protein n=1 Tax=Chionoecetes opilio TaxID=41210 RepID=A0A8J5CEF7_CHIOP|nr:hypothetical protein GWK47_021338 [Chionoecetes opilio]